MKDHVHGSDTKHRLICIEPGEHRRFEMIQINADYDLQEKQFHANFPDA